MTTATTYTQIEIMPEYLRGSHRAAGNWGTYPANGAERKWVRTEDVCIDDDDEYDHVIRAVEVGPDTDLTKLPQGLREALLDEFADLSCVDWEDSALPSDDYTFTARCFGVDGDEPGEVSVRIERATINGIRAYRYREQGDGPGLGLIRLSRDEAANDAQAYCDECDES